jgi:very-short-patch-repair endonuclease
MRADVSDAKRAFAKSLRTDATDAERKLWSILRAGRFDRYKFKRQVPIDGYIADFVCFEARLILEADGGQHAGSAHDARRDQHFADAGFMTLRIWNNDILANIDGVGLILVALRRRL